MKKPIKLHYLAITAIIFLLYNLQVTTADLSSDAEALLQFASTVPHVRKLNWNSTIPICTSWVGITCNDEGTRVIAIHLPGHGLFGQIPPNSIGKLDALRILSLRSNFLNGSLPSDIPSIPTLQFLYLQNNNFTGDIPTPLSVKLSILDLSFNSFSGNLPQTLNNLTRLTSLNLQYNFFSGPVPKLNLTRLRLLNVSHNSLNGSIPSSLQKFPVSSFSGNSFLCGTPLSECSYLTPQYSPSLPVRPKKHNKKLRIGAILGIAVGGFLLLILLAIFLFCFLKKKDRDSVSELTIKAVPPGKNEKSDDFGSGVQAAEKNKLVFFEGSSYNFDLEDLLRASAEVLGKGSYGTTYKAILDEGTTVVVKRVREVGVAKKEFDQHMEFVGRIGRHPNIVPLCAYYFSKDEKLLVYEYMITGSLSAVLHGYRGLGRTPLDWETRVKISLGAAKGISHIHTEGGARFTHGNIKASNILLTTDFNGCVSDLGLAPLMNFPPTKPRYIGYYAPEVLESRKLTQESDVYSFGVLLLELLTGKPPLPSSGHDEVVDLPRWVRSVVREEWTAEVFDEELMRYPHVEEEMVQMLQIGLACVTKVPDMRPSMDDVVKMIVDLRSSDSSEHRASSDDNRSKGSNVQTP
uniref:probable inactive receptor kinase At5g58300 n=1 Tax=Erigeron canadensis TaxID=72917 RepID=UPI001CB8F97C|nr:probable inactive receptor kinase At5g58300 [Erigeron canadensis]XP_043632367.1 probable inactive receptor kinase At5g58300 [Erigeron canadensis]